MNGILFLRFERVRTKSPVDRGGMAQVARDAGLSRESLYKALSGERSPGFDTILKVIEALGLRLHAKAARSSQNRR